MKRALFACVAVLALHGQQEFRLPSGLRCVLLEKHDQPLIRLELVTRWAPSEEPAKKPGIAGFLAAVLRAGGAGPYSRPAFNRALDDLGTSIDFQSRRNAFQWTLATDSRSQEAALELLADAVFRPTFDLPLVEAQRQALSRLPTPWERAQQRFLWRLRDPATEVFQTDQVLERVEYADLQAFRRRVLRPEASTLVLHGDLSLAQAKELVFMHFGLWGPSPEPPLGAPAADSGPGPRLTVVLDAAPEAELWAGREAGVCRPEVAELLGILLARMPLVPGIRRTCALEPGGPLLLKLQGPSGLVVALQDTLATLQRGFTDEEVGRARIRWKARMAALPLHPQDQIHRYQEGVLDPDFQKRVDAVGTAEINRALAELLDPASLRFLLLGGDEALVKSAEKAGFGPR